MSSPRTDRHTSAAREAVTLSVPVLRLVKYTDHSGPRSTERPSREVRIARGHDPRSPITIRDAYFIVTLPA